MTVSRFSLVLQNAVCVASALAFAIGPVQAQAQASSDPNSLEGTWREAPTGQTPLPHADCGRFGKSGKA